MGVKVSSRVTTLKTRNICPRGRLVTMSTLGTLQLLFNRRRELKRLDFNVLMYSSWRERSSRSLQLLIASPEIPQPQKRKKKNVKISTLRISNRNNADIRPNIDSRMTFKVPLSATPRPHINYTRPGGASFKSEISVEQPPT